MNYFESWLFEIINQCNAPLCFSDRSINVDFGTLWHHRSTKVKTFKYFRGDTSFNAYWTQYNRLKQIKSRAKAAGISVQQLWLCVCATLSVSTTEIWQRMSVCVFLNWKLKKMHRARVCLCVTIFALLNEPLGESQGGCRIPHAAVEVYRGCEKHCNNDTL